MPAKANTVTNAPISARRPIAPQMHISSSPREKGSISKNGKKIWILPIARLNGDLLLQIRLVTIHQHRRSEVAPRKWPDGRLGPGDSQAASAGLNMHFKGNRSHVDYSK